MPLVVLMIMLLIQFALYQHASHVVTAAAQEGVAGALVERGSAPAGRARALSTMGRHGSGLARGVVIDVERTHDRARVTVAADVVSLIPGFRFHVTGAAEGSVERFRARDE